MEGGWYILRDWNIQDFDRNFVIKQLHVKYGVSPYFKVSVRPNPRSPGTNSITLSPAGLGLPDRSYYYTSQDHPIQLAYKQLIKDVVIYLSATKTEAEKFGDDMFHYEKRIAEITPHSYDMLNPVNTYNSIKLSELRITAPSLPLQDILTVMFPESNVTEETEVIVTSPDYLIKVSQIAATTDTATFNSYVMWTLVRKYLPYLSSDFTSTVGIFNSELLGVRQPLQRWEKCTGLVQKFMSLAIEGHFETENPISNKTKSVVQSIFQEVRDTVKERLKRYQVSNELYTHLYYKVSKLKLQIGLPNVPRREEYIKEYYRRLTIFKANLFESFKNGLIFRRKMEERLLTSPRPQDKLIAYTMQSREVSYSAALNTVIVPRAVLTQFVYENDFSSAILYGRLGVSIAKAIVSSVLPYESAWNADLRLLSPFHSTVNESHQAISSAKNCLSAFLTDHELASKEVAELTSLSTVKELSALSAAQQALAYSLEGQTHIHQPSLETYEDSALFFLAYAQTQCSVYTPQQELYDNLVNYELTQKTLLEVAWSQIPEFSTSLACSKKNEQCSDIL